MVEISSSGSGEGPGVAIPRGYSTEGSASQRWWSALFANAAFFALVLSGAALLTFGWLTVSPTPWDATTAVESTLRAMPTLTGRKDTQWKLQSLHWSESSKLYDLLVVEERSAERFRVSVDAD